MNDYTQQRWEKLSAILGDEAVPMSERADAAFDLLEQEVRAAFERGIRTAKQRPAFSPKHSREGKSAVQAGVLRRTTERV